MMESGFSGLFTMFNREDVLKSFTGQDTNEILFRVNVNDQNRIKRALQTIQRHCPGISRQRRF